MAKMRRPEHGKQEGEGPVHEKEHPVQQHATTNVKIPEGMLSTWLLGQLLRFRGLGEKLWPGVILQKVNFRRKPISTGLITSSPASVGGEQVWLRVFPLGVTQPLGSYATGGRWPLHNKNSSRHWHGRCLTSLGGCFLAACPAQQPRPSHSKLLEC